MQNENLEIVLIFLLSLIAISAILVKVLRSLNASKLKSKVIDSFVSNEKNKQFKFDEYIVEAMKKCSYTRTKSKFIKKFDSERNKSLIVLSGLSGKITCDGLGILSIKLAIVASIVGFIVGILISLELSFILLIFGLIFGFKLPISTLKKRANARDEDLKRDLPEMLDVMSLCLGSGLSFDRAIDIYAESFSCDLSRELFKARKIWQSGFASRENALRNLGAMYDSILFSRIIEIIIRSLKLGTSLVESFRDAAKDARNAERDSKEEEIKKAPVKMMIPTGTLILPAMLLLVLGPVLLELIGGGL